MTQEPENVDIFNMNTKLEKNLDGVYVLVFTGTSEEGMLLLHTHEAMEERF